MNTQGFQKLLNSQHTIEIFCFTTEQKVSFLAFLTDFKDSFSSAWNTTEVYGRMDPVPTFKNTKRSLSVAFDIPSIDIKQANANSQKLDTIIQSMYPTYTSVGIVANERGTALINSPPLFRIKFANLISSRASATIQDPTSLSDGLLGYINSFDYAPDIESGFFVGPDRNLYPKLLKASLTLNVIHEHPLGNRYVQDEGAILPRVTFNGSFPHGFEAPQPQGNNRSQTEQNPEDAGQAERLKLQSDIFGQGL